jgi:GGDEF domain-containing protein
MSLSSGVSAGSDNDIPPKNNALPSDKDVDGRMMISLTRSVSEHEQMESMQRASLECYEKAVEATGRNAVEIDPETKRQFREEVLALARKVRKADSAEALRETRICFLGAIEDYADKASRYLSSLREKVEATTRALTEVLESVKRGSEDERRLQLGLGQLNSIAQDPEVARLCPELNRAVHAVEESVEQIKKQNQYVVAQLREEIGSLKTALVSAKDAATRDPVSGVLNRIGILDKIREDLAGGRLFSLVFVWASNLEYVHRRYGGAYRDQAVTSLARRLVESAGPQTAIGRWGEDRFAVYVPRPKPEAIWLAENFSRELAGPYVIKSDGWTREIRLQLKTGVIEAPPGTPESKVLLNADKLLLALETVAAPSL